MQCVERILSEVVCAGAAEALASVHESGLEARDRHGKTALAWASYMGQVPPTLLLLVCEALSY